MPGFSPHQFIPILQPGYGRGHRLEGGKVLPGELIITGNRRVPVHQREERGCVRMGRAIVHGG
ncbi:MAG TPA: hypothetical protein DCM14_08060 [Clostridiales bacterium UBA8153]|nr:hypothetical protein [Clostridiales bacterium UBA8153]